MFISTSVSFRRLAKLEKKMDFSDFVGLFLRDAGFVEMVIGGTILLIIRKMLAPGVKIAKAKAQITMGEDAGIRFFRYLGSVWL